MICCFAVCHCSWVFAGFRGCFGGVWGVGFSVVFCCFGIGG